MRPKLALLTTENSITQQPHPRLSKSNKQNSKAVRLKAPSRHSSLKEQVTTDLPPPPLDGAEYFTTDQTFR